MIIIDDFEQLSPEWFAEHAGKPGAASFDKIITTTGAPSKQREKLLYKLAGETLIGYMENGYTSYAMQTGIEREDAARSLYELINNVEVRTVAMCYATEQRDFLCSPDGLIEPDGLLEIKCPQIHTHIEYLLKGKLPTEYFQQVQGSLLVTGRKWLDFISYYPGLDPFTIRVYPDEKFITALHNELTKFCADLKTIIQKLGGKK